MKKILLPLLFIITVSSAHAGTVVEKQLFCDWISVIFETLTEKYGESPIWVGNGESTSKYSVFVNPKTGSFTIVQFNHEIACIVGVGQSSINLPTKPTL